MNLLNSPQFGFFFFVGGEEMFEMNLSLKFNSRPEWKSILKPVIVLRSVFSISLTAYLSFWQIAVLIGCCFYSRLPKRLLQRGFRTATLWANFGVKIFAYICQSLSVFCVFLGGRYGAYQNIGGKLIWMLVLAFEANVNSLHFFCHQGNVQECWFTVFVQWKVTGSF